VRSFESACELGLLEEGGIDYWLDVLLADVDESGQFQALEQVDSLSQLLLIEQLQVLRQWREVGRAYFLHQLACFLVGGPGLAD
jgi:hypothetical protein